MPFSQDNTGSPLTADGTWQTLITGDNSGNSAPAHYALSLFPETFYRGDKIRVLVETFDENDSTWHYYFGKELGYSDIKTPDKFIDADNSFIEAGIVSRWQLNSSLTDSVGNEDLTDNGSIAYDTSDKKEGSASAVFDGSTDYLTTTNDEPYDFEHTDPFSISLWVKLEQDLGASRILTKQSGTGAAGFMLTKNSNESISWRLEDTAANAFQVLSSVISIGGWNHIVATYDGSSNQSGLKIYINGALDNTGSSSTISNSILNNEALTIGAESDGGLKFSGHLDDITIYNYELSASQVKENFNSYLGLITHINFDNQVEDQFGSNDGTWTGTALYGVGKIDRSGLFDGSSRVELANESNFDFERTDAFSISGWFKGSNTGSAEVLISKRTSGAAAGYTIEFDASNNLDIKLTNTASSNEIDVSHTTSLRNGAWRHFVMTYDGSSSASGITLYVDGSSVALTTNTDNLTSSILNAVAVSIGAYQAGGSEFTGNLDDFKIWDKELTAEEVEKEYGSKSGEIFNVFLPKQKFRVKLQQYKGHFRKYDFILYEVA